MAMATTTIAIPSDVMETMSNSISKDILIRQKDDEASQEDSVDDEDEDFVKVEDAAVAAQVEQAISKLECKSSMADPGEISSPHVEGQEAEMEQESTPDVQPAKEEDDVSKLVETPDQTSFIEETSLKEEQPKDSGSEVKGKIAQSPSMEGTLLQEEHSNTDSSEDLKATEKPKPEQPQAEIGEWAAFARDIFLLSPFPTNWEAPHLVDQCLGKDENIWKCYFDSRCLLSKACDDHNEEQKEEMTPSQVYRQKLENTFKKEWHESTLGMMLLKHTYHRAVNVVKDAKNMLNNATVVSTIFSPYFLARGVQICMRYHRSLNDFWCSWHIQFVSLKDMKEDKMAYWRPHLTDMWELCSNGYAKMPTNEVGFMPVEDIDTGYLTPNMVRKIRKWLFGSIGSVSFCDDLTLLKYVLGSGGAIHNFNILDADIGYTWKASETQVNDMSLYGKVNESEVEKATTTGTNWLEFQCRMITGSLRPIDHWFDPYDSKYYKGVWGEKVMEYRYKKHGIFEQDEHIRGNPHKVWELAEKGIRDTTIEHKVMRVVGKL